MLVLSFPIQDNEEELDLDYYKNNNNSDDDDHIVSNETYKKSEIYEVDENALDEEAPEEDDPMSIVDFDKMQYKREESVTTNDETKNKDEDEDNIITIDIDHPLIM